MPDAAVYLTDRIEHWAAATPDEPAVTYGERTWTWSQLADRVGRVSAGLVAAGVGDGDRVAFLDKNHPACVEVTLGASAIGAAHAIINWRLAGDELDYTINDSGARILFVGVELMPAIELIRERLTSIERIIAVTPDGGPDDEYEGWLGEHDPIARLDDVDPDDVCLVMYSSGTTGRPKGVMLTHRNLMAHTRNAHEGWGFDTGDKCLVAMPLFHVGGTSYIMFGLHDGVHCIMTREPEPKALAAAIMAGANHAFLVPAVAAGILAAGEDAIALFSRLRLFTYGASPMPPPVLRAAQAAWPDTKFLQVYGMTEMAGVITHLLPEAHDDPSHQERLLSAGTLLPGAELRVVNPATLRDVAAGESGELWFRSEQCMRGFLNRPDATAEVIVEDGWLRSGDIGRVDDGGFVYVEDRLKDMIITGGENVYSPEVERVLAEHPAVAELAVIGVPDDKWGETVKAVVALVPDATVAPDELIAFCRERLAHYKSPSSVDIVDELPRNPTGKILKRELRKAYPAPWA
ncbi:long-chain-fatty-acid--CoA ligase [Solicola gregarius]|uniref:Long-chain-fatty-acid--CoA ligase n=1 Tax=Solicola gregarius TaxID=2908642 RepID=A0AA46TEV8_9ACTN|nr:long-chain-fatty-acid--CoA ligase [Solicola gregarius]UYM03527.1 long-chain-fatty-acid--CoA ligase [Solicola gregarius]